MVDMKKPVGGEGGGIFQGIADHLKLVLRLWQDTRINPFLKLLPFGSFIYMLSPLDIAIPVVDDVGVIWFFTYLFIELCPDYIVEEHKSAIKNTVTGSWRDEDVPEFKEEDILDADYEEKETGE